MELTVLGLTFLVTLLIGLPIYVVMGLSVIAYFLLAGINPVTIPHRVFAGIEVFVLMAVPFFNRVYGKEGRPEDAGAAAPA